MKRIFSALALLCALAITAGCHAQLTPNPTTYICPAATAAAYTPLNQSSPATGLTYTDSKPPAAVNCYVAQAVISSTGQVSNPSNTAGPVTTSGTNSVLLTWSAPTSGATPTGYVLSRASATASTLNAPTISNTQLAEVEHDTGNYQLAENEDPGPILTASLR